MEKKNFRLPGMRATCFLTTLAVLLSSSTDCVRNRRPTKMEKVPQQLVVTPSKFYDSIGHADTSNQIIKLINQTESKIEIDSILPECSCTQVTYSPEILLPGDTLPFSVTFIPYGTGNYYQTIKIFSSTTESPDFLVGSFLVK